MVMIGQLRLGIEFYFLSIILAIFCPKRLALSLQPSSETSYFIMPFLGCNPYVQCSCPNCTSRFLNPKLFERKGENDIVIVLRS